MDVKVFYDALIEQEISFFSGVPDSLLKSFCAYVQDNHPLEKHVLAANEGNAVSVAAGSYLASGKPGLVYLQNSGLGNCVNPLLSLLDEDVYNIPALILIGYRGEPGVKDEPQHVKQGKLTIPLLKTMGIEYKVLDGSITERDALATIKFANEYMLKFKKPYALIIKKGYFDSYTLQNKATNSFPLTREDAIKLVVDKLTDEVVVSTTGMTSRELFEYREDLKQDHSRDFLTVGSMGHASQIALGIALTKPNKKVVCLDGDGATLMHTGGMAIAASMSAPNMKHILLNNGAHDSVGGQPTVGFDIDFSMMAMSMGYKRTFRVDSEQELTEILPEFLGFDGLALLEVKLTTGARKDLGRPTTTPIENKDAIMTYLQS